MQKKSFTLIEMLIVVVIIGILAAALIPRLASVQARARDTKRKADLHQIGVALGIYKQDHGGYDNFGGTDQNANGTAYNVYAKGSDSRWYQAWPDEDTYPITNTQQLANHYSNNQFLAYLPKLLRKYMTSVPMESNINAWRVAHGWGYWQVTYIYGYALGLLPRAGTTLDSIVLGARMESDGSSANWVSRLPVRIGGWWSSVGGTALGSDFQQFWSSVPSSQGVYNFTNNWSMNVPGWSNSTWVGAIWWYKSNGQNYWAQAYDDLICNTVSLDDLGTRNDGNGNCKAWRNGDSLRYVYVQ